MTTKCNTTSSWMESLDRKRALSINRGNVDKVQILVNNASVLANCDKYTILTSNVNNRDGGKLNAGYVGTLPYLLDCSMNLKLF